MHRTRLLSRRDCQQTQNASSWLALVAQTSLDSAHTVLRVQIQLQPRLGATIDQRPHRLVVQVYPDAPFPECLETTPCASAQRAVSLPQLRRGLEVPLVMFSGRRPVCSFATCVTVAWVEPGAPQPEAAAAPPSPSATRWFAVVAHLLTHTTISLTLVRAPRLSGSGRPRSWPTIKTRL
jgi:hypothetical protein